MRLSRLAVSAVVAAFVGSPAQAATRIDDPRAFITGIYANLRKTPPQDIYTPRLAGLIAADRKETGTAPPTFGRLDFSFWYDAQDTDDAMPGKVTITEEDVQAAPDRKLVDVKFTNYSPKENHFYFEKTPAGWKLDDVSSPSDGWTLSLILKYGR
jgi:hypothetical protein